MQRDIVDVHYALDINEYMVLDLDATDDNGKKITFINPSCSADYIYFRTIFEKDIWVSHICMYNKHQRDFHIVPEVPYVNNIEDLRIFDYKGSVWFVGYSRNVKSKLFETHIGFFNKDCTEINRLVGHILEDKMHIKNITPLICPSGLLWFIDIHTTKVFSCSMDGGVAYDHDLDVTLMKEKLSMYANDVFGSTQYVHLSDTTYGGLVHITKKIGSRVYYVYLWIEIDVGNSPFCIVFVSRPFVIHKLGLIFASHIEKLANGDIQIMFGQDDSQTCRCVTTLDSLRGI